LRTFKTRLGGFRREFRRRTKTQASFSTEEAGLTLLFGLVAFRQIELRRICGYVHVAAMLASKTQTTSSQPAKCATGCMNCGARDRVRTGDPELGNVTGTAKLLWFSSYERK
jgi:hypothetical protein